MRTAFFSFGLVLLLAGPASAWDPSLIPGGTSRASAAAFMRSYGMTSPPFGFVRFCEANRSECTSKGNASTRLQLTPDRFSELDLVNRTVNSAVEPALDRDLYGIEEYWTLPGSRGDCEDYALLKRKMLIARGWPTSTLLLTVVRDDRGEGHAVLTVRTLEGDFVLDNKIPAIRSWNETDYDFVMRQSSFDPQVWISLDPADAHAPSSLAGVEAKRQ